MFEGQQICDYFQDELIIYFVQMKGTDMTVRPAAGRDLRNTIGAGNLGI